MILVTILLVLAYDLTRGNISALPAPSSLEDSLATTVRDRLIARSARTVGQPSVPDSPAAISQGQALFGMECASCHGQDGRSPTPIGKALYPRVLDLGSGVVQGLSARELFWVIYNGIRFSGMPGFARIDTAPDIWRLVYYVRTLGSAKTSARVLLPHNRSEGLPQGQLRVRKTKHLRRIGLRFVDDRRM